MNEKEKEAYNYLKKYINWETYGERNIEEEIKIILKLINKQQKEKEKLKEAYKILKDDIKGHRIVYVDTPEFEENYISKDKIKEKIEKIKKDEEFYREHFRMFEFNGKINILKELLGD